MQTPRIRLTNPEAARAIRDTPVLHRFISEQNPSEVAKAIGMPANLVHHHVKRGVELGLVLETRREAGRVYYQLAAKEFTHARTLLEMDEGNTSLMARLSQRFLEASQRCELTTSNADDPDYHVIGFAPSELPLLENQPVKLERGEHSHPSHFQSRSLKLTAATYQTLLLQIAQMISKLETESDADAALCSVTVIGFAGPLRDGHDDSQILTSFLEVLPQ